MFEQKVLYLPIDTPRVEPSDWDRWWEIWNANARPVNRLTETNNPAAKWKGFDIWRAQGIDIFELSPYDFQLVPCAELFSSIFDNLDKFPFAELQAVRIMASYERTNPHQDSRAPYQVRSLMWDNNPAQTWSFWVNSRRTVLQLPESTNTWMYADSTIKHSTSYDPRFSKLLVWYIGTLDPTRTRSVISTSNERFPDFVF
jgi:hypothetical protein